MIFTFYAVRLKKELSREEGGGEEDAEHQKPPLFRKSYVYFCTFFVSVHECMDGDVGYNMYVLLKTRTDLFNCTQFYKASLIYTYFILLLITYTHYK